MQLKVIAAILVAMAGVIFATQNNVPVTVNFLLWRFDSSLALVLLSALALGAIIIALLTTPDMVRRQWRQSRQKRRIEELEGICNAQKEKLSAALRLPDDEASVTEKKHPPTKFNSQH